MSNILEANKELLLTIKKQREELENLRKASQTIGIPKTDFLLERADRQKANFVIAKESGFEEEIKKYLELLELLDPTDDVTKEVLGVLPQEDSYDKKSLVKRLYIEYYRKIMKTEELILAEKKMGTGDDELLSFYEDIKRYEQIQNALKQSINLDPEIEKADIPKNKLLFLTTNGGRIRVFENIDSIDPKCYPALSELFNSIIEGTFRERKSLAGGNNKFSGILEVRNLEYMLRVFYRPVSDNYYAILGAIIKKTNKSSHYRTGIRSMINNYNQQKELLEEGLKDPEFCRQHEMYTQALFTKLGSSKKDDVKIKIKTTNT